MDDVLAHDFLVKCLDGTISLSGSEPPIAMVLRGEDIFEPIPASGRFKEGSGNKFVTALSDLYCRQRMILGLPNVPRFRSLGLVDTWLTNLCNEEANKQET